LLDEFELGPTNGQKQVTPEKAQKILKEHGTIVTLEQAKRIVEFRSRLADIAIGVYLDCYTSKPNEHRKTSTK